MDVATGVTTAQPFDLQLIGLPAAGDGFCSEVEMDIGIDATGAAHIDLAVLL